MKKDSFGNTIEVGDRIAYVTKTGSWLETKFGTVVLQDRDGLTLKAEQGTKAFVVISTAPVFVDLAEKYGLSYD